MSLRVFIAPLLLLAVYAHPSLNCASFNCTDGWTTKSYPPPSSIACLNGECSLRVCCKPPTCLTYSDSTCSLKPNAATIQCRHESVSGCDHALCCRRFPRVPTEAPSLAPSEAPTHTPTSTHAHNTHRPTHSPSSESSLPPTHHPHSAPTHAPSVNPTTTPIRLPSRNTEPTEEPTSAPTMCAWETFVGNWFSDVAPGAWDALRTQVNSIVQSSDWDLLAPVVADAAGIPGQASDLMDDVKAILAHEGIDWHSLSSLGEELLAALLPFGEHEFNGDLATQLNTALSVFRADANCVLQNGL